MHNRRTAPTTSPAPLFGINLYAHSPITSSQNRQQVRHHSTSHSRTENQASASQNLEDRGRQVRVLGKERKGKKSLESQSAESEGIILMKFTFVRSSLDKGAEKSQCGENEGLHCVFLFLVKRGGSRSIATWTFFLRRKKSRRRRRRVLSASLLEDSYIGGNEWFI